jgi:hypothetical protein
MTTRFSRGCVASMIFPCSARSGRNTASRSNPSAKPSNFWNGTYLAAELEHSSRLMDRGLFAKQSSPSQHLPQRTSR